MKRFWTLLILVYATSQSMFAQLTDNLKDLSGQLADSTSLVPIPYATIQVFQKGQDNGTGCTSGADGKFTMKVQGNTDYQLVISCIGYITVHQNVSVHRDNVQLGDIRLRESDQELSEVVITGRKKLIKLSPAGLTYSMKDDPLSQSENLLFALRNVPLVDVDGEGNIKVKGSSNYAIYLNGKSYRIATMNPKEILQSIPASTISRVEVITQPDARYDVDAGVTIINIITEKKQLDGYRVTLTGAGETYPKANGGASLIMVKGKVNLSLGYNYDYTKQVDQPTFLNRENYQNGDLLSKLNENGTVTGDNQDHTARAMLDIDIDSINSFYADAHLLFSNINSARDNLQTYSIGETVAQYSRITDKNKMSSGASEANFIYRNLYKKDKSERFTLGYRYSYNPDKRSNEANEYKEETTDGATSDYDLQRLRNTSNGGLHEHTVQFDYVIPIHTQHTIRVGAKDVLRKANAVPEYNIWDNDTQNWKEGTLYGNENIGKMNQTQNIAGVYFSYSFRKGNFGANLGGRAESSNSRIKFADSPQYNFSSNLFDFIPRCSFSYNPSRQSQLSLDYSLGVRRPSIWELNPFREQLDEYTLTYGNPNLESEKQHNVTASYMYYTNKLFINFGVEYNRTNNSIVEYPFQSESDSKLLNYTYGNMGRYQQFGGSFYVNYRPVNEVSLTANGGISDNQIRSEVLDLKQHGISYNAGVSCDANFSKGWLLGGRWSVFQRAPKVRSSYRGFQMYSLYVYKRFLDNNLSIGFVANQPFNKYIESRVTMTGPDFWQRRGNDITGRSFAVRLSYSFGSGKRANIKRDQTIRNEDLLQGTGVR
ncbi:TonB-dependent receptor domain-containing protein [Bacteroides sp.]